MSIHEGRLAVNVKVQRLPEVPLPDDVRDDKRERIYNSLVNTFWADAQFIAHQHGYSGVFSEGRSGGWCVPFYQFKDRALQQFTRWPGQGPEYGYPQYPYPNERHDVAIFDLFEKDILNLIEDLKQVYVQRCTEGDED